MFSAPLTALTIRKAFIPPGEWDDQAETARMSALAPIVEKFQQQTNAAALVIGARPTDFLIEPALLDE